MKKKEKKGNYKAICVTRKRKKMIRILHFRILIKLDVLRHYKGALCCVYACMCVCVFLDTTNMWQVAVKFFKSSEDLKQSYTC